MDIIVQFGVCWHLRHEVSARGSILITAMLLDAIVLGIFLTIKWQQDVFIVAVAAAGILAIFAFERLYLHRHRSSD